MRDCLERIKDGTSRDRGSEKTNDVAADKAKLIADGIKRARELRVLHGGTEGKFRRHISNQRADYNAFFYLLVSVHNLF